MTICPKILLKSLDENHSLKKMLCLGRENKRVIDFESTAISIFNCPEGKGNGH